jgi:hypothetical protein
MGGHIEQAVANDLASGAPGTLELEGKTYLVAQPTKSDWIALKKHLAKIREKEQKSYLARIVEEVKGLDPEVQKVAIQAAVQVRKDDKEISSDALSSMILEPEGMRFWVWKLARKHHPELTLECVSKLITEENVNDVAAEMLGATSMRDVDPNSSGGTGS